MVNVVDLGQSFEYQLDTLGQATVGSGIPLTNGGLAYRTSEDYLSPAEDEVASFNIRVGARIVSEIRGAGWIDSIKGDYVNIGFDTPAFGYGDLLVSGPNIGEPAYIVMKNELYILKWEGKRC